jgi:hypothetical protein
LSAVSEPPLSPQPFCNPQFHTHELQHLSLSRTSSLTNESHVFNDNHDFSRTLSDGVNAIFHSLTSSKPPDVSALNMAIYNNLSPIQIFQILALNTSAIVFFEEAPISQANGYPRVQNH